MPQEYINSPVLCHNLVRRDRDHLSPSQNITLAHIVHIYIQHIDDIMLTESGEQEVAAMLDVMVAQMHISGWGNKSKQNSREFLSQ